MLCISYTFSVSIEKSHRCYICRTEKRIIHCVKYRWKGSELSSFILNTFLTIFFHKFHAFGDGKGWFGHLNVELGERGLFPSRKGELIVLPSGFEMSPNVATWRYIRQVFIWILLCFDKYSLLTSAMILLSFLRWWLTVRNVVVKSLICDFVAI